MIDRIIAGDPCKHFIVRLHLVSKYIVEYERAATKPRMCDEAPPFGYHSTYLTWLAYSGTFLLQMCVHSIMEYHAGGPRLLCDSSHILQKHTMNLRRSATRVCS